MKSVAVNSDLSSVMGIKPPGLRMRPGAPLDWRPRPSNASERSPPTPVLVAEGLLAFWARVRIVVGACGPGSLWVTTPRGSGSAGGHHFPVTRADAARYA